MAVYCGQLLRREVQVLHRLGQLNNLGRFARADQGRGDPFIPQYPGHGHLRQALAATLRNGIERAYMLQVLLAQVVGAEGAAAGPVDARIGRYAA